MDADGYVIIDKGRIWSSRKGQQVWKTSGQAKNAWNFSNSPKFSEQSAAVCRPVRFIDMDTGHYFA
jgi:hypothetical protein